MKKRMVKAKLMEVYWGLSQRGYVPMIVLTTEAKQKKMAQALANTWAQLLADKINGISTFRLKEVYQFIVNESEASQNELSSKEAALAEFKKAAHMPLLELELKAREMDFYMYRRELNDIQTSSKTKGTQARDPEALKEREGLLAALADKSQKEISELQTKIVEAQQRSGQLQREVDTLRMNYELLQQKKVQFRISNVEGSTQARVVAWAAEPERHVRPKRFLITLIAGCAGLVGSALLIVFDAYRK
jgi:uncharacterized protein involved in exopolysaccharide biosynthesis